MLPDISSTQVSIMLELFYLHWNNKCLAICSMIFDDEFLMGLDNIVQHIISRLNTNLEFETINQGSGLLEYPKFSVFQDRDFNMSIIEDENLNKVECCLLTSVCGRHENKQMNKLQVSEFSRTNCSFVWLDATALLFCAHFSVIGNRKYLMFLLT